MSLLQMSFSGAVFILAVLLVRAFTIRRLPKKVFSVLWKIVILRLLIPVSLPSALSIYTYLGQYAPAQKAAPSPATLPEGIPLSIQSVPSPGTPQTNVFPTDLSAAPAKGPSVWFLVWCIGMTVCALFFLASYLTCRRNFKTALPAHCDYIAKWQKEQRWGQRIEIRRLDGIASPLAYGIFKPVILLPKSTDWEDTETLKYILTHEYVHILRLDALTKLAFTAALCIHWFNPAVWTMFLFFHKDIELACDEEVLRHLGETSKAPYALALIHLEERKSNPALLYNSFSKNSVEERIRSIMKHKKLSKSTIAIAAVMIFTLTAAFATSPAKAEGDTEIMGGNNTSGTETASDPAAEMAYDTEDIAESGKFELKIEKSFEVVLAPGEETELATIKTKQGQVIVVTQVCEGIHKVGIKLDGTRLSSGEARVENFGIFSSECIHKEEERNLILYNSGSSDLNITIGYFVMEADEYNRLGTWDLLNALKKEYQK